MHALGLNTAVIVYTHKETVLSGTHWVLVIGYEADNPAYPSNPGPGTIYQVRYADPLVQKPADPRRWKSYSDWTNYFTRYTNVTNDPDPATGWYIPKPDHWQQHWVTIERDEYAYNADWGMMLNTGPIAHQPLTYLPEVKGNYNGWNSTIVIHNDSSSAINATVTFYNTNGTPVGTQPSTAIGGNGTLAVSVSSVVNNFMGSAVVAATGDVSVVVRDQNGDELDEYNGILASGGSPGWEQVGSTVYTPIIKNGYGGCSSRLLIANAGSAAATAYVQFYNADSGASAGSTSKYLVTNGSGQVEANNCTVSLCSAMIWSDNGQPLAVVVLERRDNYTDNRTMHNAFSTGTTSNFVPVVKNNVGGQTTGVSVQNVGSQPANISITCYDSAGQTYYCGGTRYGVPSKATTTFYMSAASSPLGSAVVSANQPIASLIYEGGDPYKLCTNADLSGTTTAYAPELYGNYSQDYQT